MNYKNCTISNYNKTLNKNYMVRTEKELLSMAQQFTGLPMEDLIGGPLNASAKANAAMALTQY